MSGCEGPGVYGGLSPEGVSPCWAWRCPGDPVLVLRVEQLEHRQRYRVSMSSNHQQRQRILHKNNINEKINTSQHKNMYCSVADCLHHFSQNHIKTKRYSFVCTSLFVTEDIKKD